MNLMERAYPSMRMHLVCRHCRGNSKAVLDRYKCPLCRKRPIDYKDQNLEAEVEEYRYLYTTWLKAKAFRQNTTGISKIDLVITTLWGKPHDGRWRDYSTNPTAARLSLSSGVVVRSVTCVS